MQLSAKAHRLTLPLALAVWPYGPVLGYNKGGTPCEASQATAEYSKGVTRGRVDL